MGLPLGAGLVHLVAVLAVEVALGPDYRKVEFRHRGDVDGRMSLGKVVDEHSAPLESQLAVIALEDKQLVVGW